MLLSLAAVGFLAYLIDEIAEGGSFHWDSVLLLALRVPGHLDRPIGPGWLPLSAIDISALGGFTLLWLFGALVLSFLVFIHRRAEAAWLFASLAGASMLDASLKAILHRPRPMVVPHLTMVDNASFPSGHAMISAAIYLTIAAMLAEAQRTIAARVYLMAAATLIVFLIGASRIYLGVHWPS
ncbi:MAG: phosphatase PAP2 family protein, partial [Caulobacteraceae bacterium]